MRRAAILATVLLAAGGCRSDDEPAASVTQAPPPATPPAALPATTALAQPASQPAAGPATVASELEALIAAQGSVTFASYNGKWMGGDTDSQITFMPDGVAHTFLYADDILSYRGTFTVEADGTIVARFPTMEGAEEEPWPPRLSLRNDGASLLLFPKDAAVRAAYRNGRWPYRQKPPADEPRIREQIRKYVADEPRRREEIIKHMTDEGRSREEIEEWKRKNPPPPNAR